MSDTNNDHTNEFKLKIVLDEQQINHRVTYM